MSSCDEHRAGLAAFLWALRSGQHEDLDCAASRILFDDDPPNVYGMSDVRYVP